MSEIDLNDIDPRRLSDREFAELLARAETDGGDLAAMSPQGFARLIKRASSKQISAVMDDAALRKPVLDEIFGRMASRFRADKAPRRPSAIHWHITGGEDTARYETWIADGAVTTSDNPSREPRTTLTMSGEQFIKLVSGNGSPTMMFMTGKLTLEGDIGFAAGLTTIFDIPKA